MALSIKSIEEIGSTQINRFNNRCNTFHKRKIIIVVQKTFVQSRFTVSIGTISAHLSLALQTSSDGHCTLYNKRGRFRRFDYTRKIGINHQLNRLNLSIDYHLELPFT